MDTATRTPTPYVFDAGVHAHLIPYLAALHGSCITNDQMVGTFLPPLNHEKLLNWWKDRIAEVNGGSRVIILLLEESDPGSRAKGDELTGAIMLHMPTMETGPHVAFLESLLVNPRHRRKGAARILVTALEIEAIQKGKTLLVSSPFSFRPCIVTPD